MHRSRPDPRPRSACLRALALSFSLSLGLSALAGEAHARRSLADYKHLRALSVDLLGRAPTRAEVDAFEKSDEPLEAWIDRHLGGADYADRMARVWMDALRLEPGPAVQHAPDATTLYRRLIHGPDGREQYVYYRKGQRREREATDGDFCLTAAELEEDTRPLKKPASPKIAPGQKPGPPAQPPKGAAPKAPEGGGGMAGPMGGAEPPRGRVTQKTLDAHTVVVRPWWLYRDYREASPSKRLGEGWADADPLYRPVESLLAEPDGSPTREVRVCREEAQPGEVGHIHASRRPRPAPGAPPPPGRKTHPPQDSAYALAHRAERVACGSRLAHTSSVDCGCGAGLERCLPSDADGVSGGQGNAFYHPLHAPLGLDRPIDNVRQGTGKWFPLWWSQEARHFLTHLFEEDRDVREMLTSRSTYVNGPLAQFYRAGAPAGCCGPEASFGMVEEDEPLFRPRSIPEGLLPHDVSRWVKVDDRGGRAAGLLTMPIFLEKYASRRARGAAVHTAFLCRSFVAEGADLPPSTEPDLTVRPGCSTCHAALEPLAAYFARVEETSWVFLPPSKFPAENPACKRNAQGKIAGQCNAFYDPAFATAEAGVLKGAKAGVQHADEAPLGAGRAVSLSPDFARCSVERVASSFLGRPLGPDDRDLVDRLAQVLSQGGFRARPMVKALLTSPAYLRADDLLAPGDEVTP